MSGIPTRRGQYNRKVEVLAPAQVGDNGWGEAEDGFTVFAKPWAFFGKPSGSAVIRAGTAAAEVSVSIRVPFRRGYASGMCVVIGSLRYLVKVPLYDEGDRDHVDLLCEAGVSHG